MGKQLRQFGEILKKKTPHRNSLQNDVLYSPPISHGDPFREQKSFLYFWCIFRKNTSQNGPLFGKHFLKKSISYESWGQATRLKSCAYGCSSYELFIQNPAEAPTSYLKIVNSPYKKFGASFFRGKPVLQIEASLVSI